MTIYGQTLGCCISLLFTVISKIADSEGRAPLHWAVDHAHVKAAELLMSRNSNVNLKVIVLEIGLIYSALFKLATTLWSKVKKLTQPFTPSVLVHVSWPTYNSLGLDRFGLTDGHHAFVQPLL